MKIFSICYERKINGRNNIIKRTITEYNSGIRADVIEFQKNQAA